MTVTEKALIDWFERTFKERSRAVHGKMNPKIDWATVEGRVPMSEIMTQASILGLFVHPTDFPVWWNSRRNWERWCASVNGKISRELSMSRGF